MHNSASLTPNLWVCYCTKQATFFLDMPITNTVQKYCIAHKTRRYYPFFEGLRHKGEGILRVRRGSQSNTCCEWHVRVLLSVCVWVGGRFVTRSTQRLDSMLHECTMHVQCMLLLCSQVASTHGTVRCSGLLSCLSTSDAMLLAPYDLCDHAVDRQTGCGLCQRHELRHVQPKRAACTFPSP